MLAITTKITSAARAHANRVISAREIGAFAIIGSSGELNFGPVDARTIIDYVGTLSDNDRLALSDIAMCDAGGAYPQVAYRALHIEPGASDDQNQRLINMAAAGLALTIAARLGVNVKI